MNSAAVFSHMLLEKYISYYCNDFNLLILFRNHFIFFWILKNIRVILNFFFFCSKTNLLSFYCRFCFVSVLIKMLIFQI